MSYYGNVDFATKVGLGLIPGWKSVFKFGEALDCDDGVTTDLWDGADGATSTDVWVAPTQARTHNVKSTDTDDDGDPAGDGMRTIRVYGLTSWDTAEVSEDLTLNGTTNVITSNSYVIIHRMKGLTFGDSGTNEGIITATATTDNTITAGIQAGKGQTLMAIYGVPSTQKFAMCSLYSTLHRVAAAGTAIADGELAVKENADQADAGFLVKDDFLVSHNLLFLKNYSLPVVYSGPCILKVRAISDTNDAAITGAFNGFLVDN